MFDGRSLWMKSALGITGRDRRVLSDLRCTVGSLSSLTRAEIGALGEQLASEHLAAQGFRTLARNWRCRYGELDVIAEEVTTSHGGLRRGEDPHRGRGSAASPRRSRSRRYAASGDWQRCGWLSRKSRYAALRIDVIQVRLGHRREPELTHLKGCGLKWVWVEHIRWLCGPWTASSLRSRQTSARGYPSVNLVGLPDTALQESRDRVRAAITNCGNEWPMSRLTLALSPATLRKVGSVYDLALAAAVLSAHTKTAWARLEKSVLLGELALDGRVRPVHGVPARGTLAAKQEGWPLVVVPRRQLGRSQPGGRDRSVRCAHAPAPAGLARRQGDLLPRVAAPGCAPQPMADLADVVGQGQARYAVEVAAAGAHHLMLTGPPGIGKTMLAQRLPGLLPSLSSAESLEVTAIHSVAGLLAGDTPLITRPPFVAPHHTSSVASLVGGGSGFARPGAVSRAHRGVLFLDEFAEMGSSALEALRTPLEDGEIRLASP